MSYPILRARTTFPQQECVLALWRGRRPPNMSCEDAQHVQNLSRVQLATAHFSLPCAQCSLSDLVALSRRTAVRIRRSEERPEGDETKCWVRSGNHQALVSVIVCCLAYLIEAPLSLALLRRDMGHYGLWAPGPGGEGLQRHYTPP